MVTQEIAAPKWQTFFDEFSKLHPGTKAQVQVVSPDLGVQEEIKELPFVGISYDDKGSEQGSITLLLGTERDDHAAHRIEHPTHVWLRTGGDGNGDTLAIEAEDNTKTIVQLQAPTALPK
jgi:hypothetical protein